MNFSRARKVADAMVRNTVRPPLHPTPGWRRTYKGVWHYVTYKPQHIKRRGVVSVAWLRYVWCTQMLPQTIDPQPRPPVGAMVCKVCKAKLTEYLLSNQGKAPV